MDKYTNIISLYLESINLFSDLEKRPRDYGTGELLYNSEIDTLSMIGQEGQINLTQLSKALGISKSGTSKFILKLVNKDLIIKSQKESNKKEVLFRLSEKGIGVYKSRQIYNKKIFKALYGTISHFVEDDLKQIEDFLRETSEEMRRMS